MKLPSGLRSCATLLGYVLVQATNVLLSWHFAAVICHTAGDSALTDAGEDCSAIAVPRSEGLCPGPSRCWAPCCTMPRTLGNRPCIQDQPRCRQEGKLCAVSRSTFYEWRQGSRPPLSEAPERRHSSEPRRVRALAQLVGGDHRVSTSYDGGLTTFGTPQCRPGATGAFRPPRSPSGPATVSPSCCGFTPSA